MFVFSCVKHDLPHGFRSVFISSLAALLALSVTHMHALTAYQLVHPLAGTASERAPYIRATLLNGKPLTIPQIDHATLMKAGHLVFQMSDSPDVSAFGHPVW